MIHHSDWMNNNISDKSINLIIADPPYFEVKGDFDFIWPDFGSYLQDVSMWAVECKRVLADNGCLLWWGHAKKIAYSQIIFDKYFNLENSLVWIKTDCQTRIGYEGFRSFVPVTERILFYSNKVEMTGREYVEKEYIAPRNPFSKYLRSEFERANITTREIAILFPSKTGGLTGCVSNWLNGDNVITKEQYTKIREYTNGEFLNKEYNDLTQEYKKLRHEYEEHRKEYEELRRPFNNSYKLEDIMLNAQEVHITGNYEHDTQKPLTLTKKLIQTTTRKGDLVLIPFGGSGTEVEACIDTDREYICYETTEKHYNTIKDREKKALCQPDLFNTQEIQKLTYKQGEL